MKACPAWLAGIAAILPVVAASFPVEAQSPAPAEIFAPPLMPMVLTRTVRRPLSGGKELVVRRSYEVHILPDGDGYRVEGRLLDCTVDAPESLKVLAELERTRPDAGLFPIMLDGGGMIVSASSSRPSPSLDHAAELASARLGTLPITPMDLQQARAFVRQLQARAAGSQWPVDVFHPAPGRRSEVRSLPLPQGVKGSVSVEIAGQGPEAGTLLGSLERVIVTELDGDRRVTREEWTLTKAG